MSEVGGIEGYIFQCVTAGDLGTTNLLGLLTSLWGDDLTANGSAEFRMVGKGTAYATISCQSVDPSEEVIPVGSFAELSAQNDDDDPISVLTGVCLIDTPVAGLENVLNVEAGNAGRLDETNEELLSRVQRSVSLRKPNQSGRATPCPSESPVRGIEAALLLVDGVITANVWDVAGNMHALVLGGADVDVANELHRSLPNGVRTATSGNGTLTTYDVTKIDGRKRTMVWERPAAHEVEVYALVQLIDATVSAEPDQQHQNLMLVMAAQEIGA